MSPRRPPLACAAALAASALLAPAMARAQYPAPTFAPTGHPVRVASGAPFVDVRAFAVARAGDRAVVAYVQAADPHARGALRTALLHAVGGGALERVGMDPTLAPGALAVAAWWDGARGAVAYTVARPHRGAAPARRPHSDPVAASREPLGASSLTASDVVLQALDANGAPMGRAVLVFEENARAFRVALAREPSGWLVAWTGAIGTDDEVRGTVRFSRVDDAGRVRAVATDTGFAGEVGDVLRVATRAHGAPLLAWTGQRCTSHPERAPDAAPPADPSAAIETRARSLMPQQPLREITGPPIACDEPRVYTALARADGSTSAINAGPRVASDAAELVDTPQGTALLAPAPTLTLFAIDAEGRVAPTAARVFQPTASPAVATEPASATPSTVPPPPAPDAAAITRRPLFLHAVLAPTLSLVALSPTRARVVAATQAASGPALTTTLLAPAAHAWDVGLAVDARGGTPWLFVQTGDVVGGPLVYYDGASAPAAPPEVPWPGDERLRLHVLAARAARAADTAAEGTWGPLRERPDWATNTALPGIESNLRRLRGRWDVACEPLRERARWLARHGVDASVNELAREACEMPPDPSLGVPPSP